MEHNKSLQRNQPMLLVDFNGNPVQKAWMLGGKTITVAKTNSFVCETTLMRVCNSGSTVARLKLAGADYSEIPTPSGQGTDVGFPILPGTAIFVGVFSVGQVYEVTGEDVDVTFCFDRRTIVD